MLKVDPSKYCFKYILWTFPLSNIMFVSEQIFSFEWLKGIVHQFWIYNIFFVPQQKKHFLLKVHLDLYNIDRLWAPYFLNFFRVRVVWLIWIFYNKKNVFIVGARKNVIYSKLVSNPFKQAGRCMTVTLTRHLHSQSTKRTSIAFSN